LLRNHLPLFFFWLKKIEMSLAIIGLSVELGELIAKDGNYSLLKMR
jgi:hypothetical protein